MKGTGEDHFLNTNIIHIQCHRDHNFQLKKNSLNIVAADTSGICTVPVKLQSGNGKDLFYSHRAKTN